ncbi:diacylglycerol/lipid kinase family protein [Sulfuriroseicoccus oceanibius]|uniref:Diacylglycerol kinase family lipid kinase n=1 Tax=Sulfuriroseicoccus oceanibius TaxID=2707525 RepID=A0A6B3L3Z1_9BACT|nr:diacylglycerol kinase family protein [Sulfuriroseicoccus oceanibius]QQL44497.1 diacylglycerol kinase family lipid kinase [Sulfuriroseicoccus oceanibius]
MSTVSAIPIIYNPAAKSARSSHREAQLSALSPRVQLVPTTCAGDATRIATELVQEGATTIVAAGGDGTINEVVKGIAACGDAAKDVHLGVLPVGTANVFAQELGLPMLEMGLPGLGMHRCWKIIESGATRRVDVWTGNDMPFIQLAGIGFDAAVINETSWEQKKIAGPLSYLMNAVRIFGESHENVTVTSNALAAPLQGAFVLIGNGQRYGGPMRFFPEAANDDGLLDVMVFKKQEIPALLKFFAAVGTGQIPKSGNDFEFFRCHSLDISAEGQVPFELDGELCGTTPVAIRHAGTINVKVPAKKSNVDL